jgi:hypothetical protein
MKLRSFINIHFHETFPTFIVPEKCLHFSPKLTSDFHPCAIFADKVRAYLEPGKRLYSEGRLLALLANIRRG